MVNKIIAVLLGLMLLCVMPIALAEDTNLSVDGNISANLDVNITPIDERETKSMLSPYGAEVRLLQLEKSITRNILIGDLVIKVINTNHSDANTTEAENTLNAMEMLLEDIKSTPTEGDKNVLVQTFVEQKKEARTLTADFKNQTKSLITPQDRNELMRQISQIDRNQLANINNAIKGTVRNFNAQRMRDQFDLMGFNDNNLIGRIQNGDLNLGEARKEILNEFKDLNSMEKKRIASKMKNDSIKKIIENKQMIQKARETLKDKLMNNIQKRFENLNQWIEKKALDANTNGRYNRAERLTDQSQRIQGLIDKINDRNGGMRK